MKQDLIKRVSLTLHEKPKDAPVRDWLDRLEQVLAPEPQLPPEVVADLVDRGRPRWGARTKEDGAAYIDFWARLTVRFDLPALRAGYADVVLLHGGREREREAVQIFLAAARRDPDVFIPYSGDFIDAAARVGMRKDYEVTKLAFYAHLVDKGDMDEDELRDSVREFLAEFGDDPDARPALRAIAHGSLAKIAGRS